jgi:hypothetical protein
MMHIRSCNNLAGISVVLWKALVDTQETVRNLQCQRINIQNSYNSVKTWQFRIQRSNGHSGSQRLLIPPTQFSVGWLSPEQYLLMLGNKGLSLYVLGLALSPMTLVPLSEIWGDAPKRESRD